MFTDLMCDIETTHTLSDRGAIIQIGAVKFNMSDPAHDLEVFDRCLSIPGWRFWSQDTLKFWGNQKPSVLRDILARAEPPEKVMSDFVDWIGQAGQLRFWAKPSHFDFNFISSYMTDFGYVNPFDFREATDLRSFLRGLYYPKPVEEIEVEFTGDRHNAMMDALYQIKVLFTHLEIKGTNDD